MKLLQQHWKRGFQSFWFTFQGHELHHNQSLGVLISNQTLVIQSVSRSSRGFYQCQATNPEGTVNSRNLTLNIKCKYIEKRYNSYPATINEKLWLAEIKRLNEDISGFKRFYCSQATQTALYYWKIAWQKTEWSLSQWIRSLCTHGIFVMWSITTSQHFIVRHAMNVYTIDHQQICTGMVLQTCLA